MPLLEHEGAKHPPHFGMAALYLGNLFGWENKVLAREVHLSFGGIAIMRAREE